MIHEAHVWKRPSVVLSMHSMNDPWAEDVSLQVCAGHYVISEVLLSTYKFLVVNRLRSNKKS